MNACACLADPTCQSLTTACFCPFPACDPRGACICGGGTFLACAPRASSCAPLSCGLGAVAGPDSTGCPSCDPAPPCEVARARVASLCGLPESALAGISCRYNPDCIASCLTRVQACGAIGCGFCTACNCAAAPSETDAFTNCYIGCKPI